MASALLPATTRSVAAILAASLAFGLGGAAGAEERTLRLDPGATEVRISLPATLHTVEGTAELESGEIRFDPETGEASGAVTVDARSVDTGIARRDRNLHQQVLESGRYPEIVFHPERVRVLERSGATGSVELAGRMAIHGGEHELTIPADVAVDGERLTAEGCFDLPYVEWGMTDPSTFLLRVDPVVTVCFDAAGSLDRTLLDARP